MKKKDEKEKAALIKDFKETIDSEFSNYEPKLKEERKVYTNLRNNIAKKIIEVYEAKYGEDHKIFDNDSDAYKNMINKCLEKSFKKKGSEGKNEFSAYFLPILQEFIEKKYCHRKRKNENLTIIFGVDDLKKTIDSEFVKYEDDQKVKDEKDARSTLRANIGKKMLEFYEKMKSFGKKYSEMYNNCSVEYMNSINECLNAYKKNPFSIKFSDYFYPFLQKSVRERCRLEREASVLEISFGDESKKPTDARKEYREIKKLYDYIKYVSDKYLTDDEVFQKMACLLNKPIERINQFRSYVLFPRSDSIYNSEDDINGESFFKLDKEYGKKMGDKPSLDRHENFVISRDIMMSLLDKIDVVYKEKKEKEKGVHSKVITFKILQLFKGKTKTNNTNGNSDCILCMPESYDLKGLLSKYDFIDKKMLSDYFEEGVFIKQKDLDAEIGSSGSVNHKWERFNKELRKKYGLELEKMRDSLK